MQSSLFYDLLGYPSPFVLGGNVKPGEEEDDLLNDLLI